MASATESKSLEACVGERASDIESIRRVSKPAKACGEVIAPKRRAFAVEKWQYRQLVCGRCLFSDPSAQSFALKWEGQCVLEPLAHDAAVGRCAAQQKAGFVQTIGKQTFRNGLRRPRAYEAKRGTCTVVQRQRVFSRRSTAEIAGGSITDRRIPNGVAEQGPAFGNTAASG